eukprot:maker-scaffold38_size502422-snap-gene-3.17 protein:Tk05878 transcript:maker-scaffold38_size502422-snap-gene-3.17-mRNA-1 annotation:"hypothetical protein DAPPUDRAFT_303672"
MIQLRPRLFRLWHDALHGSSTLSTMHLPSTLVKPAACPPAMFESNAGAIHHLFEDIRGNILTYGSSEAEMVGTVAKHYFQGDGKNVRPNLTMTMAKAVNAHLGLQLDYNLFKDQMKVAQVAEMYHTASLMHDDVIDHAESRRGRPSVNALWGQVPSIRAGNFSVALASVEIAKLNNLEVLHAMTRILECLVLGEFQQMSTSKSADSERFEKYLTKTFNKTASLMAFSCQAAAVLAESRGNGDRTLSQMAFDYGRDIGIAFQLVDDWLDFVTDSKQLGKPALADLQLGLATAPVLFAAQEFPEEMTPLIRRQFSGPQDVERALRLVLKSRGLDQTKHLAKQYCQNAVLGLRSLKDSPGKSDLEEMANTVLLRVNLERTNPMVLSEEQKQLEHHWLATLFRDIHSKMGTEGVIPSPGLEAAYYLDGSGKNLRPLLTLLLAQLINVHLGLEHDHGVWEQQQSIATSGELFHSASLMHDDVIDNARSRRGKPSLHAQWNEKHAVHAGTFSVATALREVAHLGNPSVLASMSQILGCLILGEFEQLKASGSALGQSGLNDKLDSYLMKSFNKTASLMAFSFKSVALLAEARSPTAIESISNQAFELGRDLGIAFQLVDDILDFMSDSEELGKPACQDLRMGIVTAPVLFAWQQFPDTFESLIERKMSQSGDFEMALDLITKADGIGKAERLAHQFHQKAIETLKFAPDGPNKQHLLFHVQKCLWRKT